MITFKENETIKDMSTLKLHCLACDIKNELNRREIADCEKAQTALYEAIEAFQRTGYESNLITNDGKSINIRDISEIYNVQLDCGFAFGIDTESANINHDCNKFFLDKN